MEMKFVLSYVLSATVLTVVIAEPIPNRMVNDFGSFIEIQDNENACPFPSVLLLDKEKIKPCLETESERTGSLVQICDGIVQISKDVCRVLNGWISAPMLGKYDVGQLCAELEKRTIFGNNDTCIDVCAEGKANYVCRLNVELYKTLYAYFRGNPARTTTAPTQNPNIERNQENKSPVLETTEINPAASTSIKPEPDISGTKEVADGDNSDPTLPSVTATVKNTTKPNLDREPDQRTLKLIPDASTTIKTSTNDTLQPENPSPNTTDNPDGNVVSDPDDGSSVDNYADANKGNEEKAEVYTEDEDVAPGGISFMSYFLVFLVLCVIGSILFHNKQKIIVLVIEGKSASSGRRPSSKEYKRLKTDDVMPSLEKSANTSNYI